MREHKEKSRGKAHKKRKDFCRLTGGCQERPSPKATFKVRPKRRCQCAEYSRCKGWRNNKELSC